MGETNKISLLPSLDKASIRFIISMGCFAAWLWSFTMFGPMLSELAYSKGVEPQALFLGFAVPHSIALLLAGTIGSKLSRVLPDRQMSTVICCSALTTGLLTALTFAVPVHALACLMALLGVVSAPLMVSYLMHLANHIAANQRGMNMALVIALGTILQIGAIALLASGNLFMLGRMIIAGFPLVSMWGIKAPLVSRNQKASSRRLQQPLAYIASFFLLIIGVYSAAGMMYRLVYPQLYEWQPHIEAFTMCFYLLGAIMAGVIADKRGRRSLLGLAFSCLGLGFLLFLSQFAFVHSSITLSLLQLGFGAMDVFLFVTLADWAEATAWAGHVIGGGLFLNVGALALSFLCLNGVVTSLNSDMVALFGLIILLLALPLLSILRETLPLNEDKDEDSEKDEVSAESTAFYNNIEELLEARALTERETSVALLILEGKTQVEICELLSITKNTIKTHVRKIYAKTGTANQRELILYVWKQTSMREAASASEVNKD